jgi:hypothetical protein
MFVTQYLLHKDHLQIQGFAVVGIIQAAAVA